MASEFAGSFYSRIAWLRFRDSYIKERVAIDGGMCEDCGKQLGYIVHHWPVPLTPYNIDNPDITYNVNNVRYVCKECHDKYPGHGVNKSLTQTVIFDDNGDPITPP